MLKGAGPRGEQGPKFSEELAAAQGALTLARKEAERLQQEERALSASLRAKDRQLASMGTRVEAADALLVKNKVCLLARVCQGPTSALPAPLPLSRVPGRLFGREPGRLSSLAGGVNPDIHLTFQK